MELYFVGVNSVDIAKKRVKRRVTKGGHGIPEKDIEKRYYESYENLKKIMPECDLVAFYDNTEGFRRFAIYKKGTQVRISQRIPEWFEKYVVG